MLEPQHLVADLNVGNICAVHSAATKTKRCWTLVPVEKLKAAVERVERDLFEEYETEVPTQAIGGRILQELKQIDPVAYVRFASVYLEFQTLTDFRDILDSLRNFQPSGISQKRKRLPDLDSAEEEAPLKA